jgi:hypothetical protein
MINNLNWVKVMSIYRMSKKRKNLRIGEKFMKNKILVLALTAVSALTSFAANDDEFGGNDSYLGCNISINNSDIDDDLISKMISLYSYKQGDSTSDQDENLDNDITLLLEHEVFGEYSLEQCLKAKERISLSQCNPKKYIKHLTYLTRLWDPLKYQSIINANVREFLKEDHNKSWILSFKNLNLVKDCYLERNYDFN